MTTSGKIKVLMAMKQITQKEMAERLGISQPTLSGKFKLDNWREDDLKKIAEICECTYEGHFRLNDGKEI